MTEDHETDSRAKEVGRVQKLALILPGLLALGITAFAVRGLLINTDWRVMMGGELFFSVILGVFVVPVTLGLYALGYGLMRHRFPKDAWWLAAGLPLLAAFVLMADALTYRLFPGRLFSRFTGLDFPPSAEVLVCDYDGAELEDHLTITFEAPPSEIRALIRDFGCEPTQDSGIELFDPVPVEGDYGKLEVDWNREIVTFEYLDV